MSKKPEIFDPKNRETDFWLTDISNKVTNLDTNYQAKDATLTALAQLSILANCLILGLGTDSFSIGKLTDSYVATANKDGIAATPSLRTLGTGSTQACAGNDSRLSNSRTPTAHASTHKGGGSDAIDSATTTVNGLMSSTDKTKLDDATSNNTASKIVARDGSGNFAANILTIAAIKPAADSTTAVQIQNASGTLIVNVDSTNGRVGINQTSPSYTFDILKSSATVPTYCNLANTTNFTANDVAVGYRVAAVLSNVSKYGYTALDRYFDSAGAYVLSTNAAGGIVLSANNSNTHLKILPTGEVGIGTASPDLPLGFAAAVGGKINFFKGYNYDIGVQSGVLQLICPAPSASTARVGIGYGNSGSFTEVVKVNNNDTVEVAADVLLASGKVLKINSTQVIGAQQTGMGATISAATAGDTYGATEKAMLQALNDKMVALETKLKTHGLIST